MSDPRRDGLRQLARRLEGSPAWRRRLAAHGFVPGDLLAVAQAPDLDASLQRALTPFPGLTRSELSQAPEGWLSPRPDELPGMHPAWSSGSSGQGPLAVPRFDADVAHRHARVLEAARGRGVEEGALVRGAFLCALPGRPEGRAWLDVQQRVPVDRVSLCREGWEERLRTCNARFWNLSPVGLERALDARCAFPLPRAVFSTALALDGPLRARAEAQLGCPVLDLFSTAETGPFAVGCPAGGGVFHVLAGGFSVDADEQGLRVTRLGDSPLPLLHYRVADRAEGLRPACPRCAHPGPTLVGLRGRTLSEKGEHSTAQPPLPAPAG